MTESMLVAVGYARTSSDINPKASIPNQIETIKKYCQKNNMLLKHVFVDEKKSGMTTDERHQYQQMKELILQGKVDVVVVSFSDRLAREAFEFIIMMQQMKKHGVDFISVAEGLRGSKMSSLEVTMIAIKNEMENQGRAKRARSGVAASIQRGNYTFTRIAFGYRVTKDLQIEIDEEAARCVQTIFDAYEKGQKIIEIVHYLNETYPKKTKWLASHIGKILDTELYTGEGELTGALKEQLPENFKIQSPVIISKEQFNRVQKLRENIRRPSPSFSFLSKGIFICPYCNRPIRANNSRGYYHCAKNEGYNEKCVTYPIKVLDKTVMEYLSTWTTTQQPISMNDKREELLKRKSQNEQQFATGKISHERFLMNSQKIKQAFNAFEDTGNLVVPLNRIQTLQSLLETKDKEQLKEYLQKNKIKFTYNEEGQIIQYQPPMDLNNLE